MIVLEKLDVRAREATLRLGAGADAPGAIDRTRGWLEQLGIEAIAVASPDGRRVLAPRPVAGPRQALWDPSVAAPAATLVAAPLVHRCQLDTDITTYMARFEHKRQSLETISAYVNALLATYEPQGVALHHLHLALYEICANTLEHGRPRRAHARLDLELRFEPESISGWIRDDCQPFDPTSHPVRPMQEQLARSRGRGYGIHIIRRCLDAIVHRIEREGNHIEFRMETHS
jgi:anti-sigma regulatory factor (Ser/Thr protein kinase)